MAKDKNDFWKAVKNMQHVKPVLSETINGVSGHSEIANMWCNHDNKLLNSCDNDSLKERILCEISDVTMPSSVSVSSCQVQRAIQMLKKRQFSCSR